MPALARGPEPLRLRLAAPSLPAQLAVVRRQMAVWAEGVGLDQETVEDIVLATHEALANVADHAYPDGGGYALVDAECQGGVASVMVRDNGRWQPPSTDTGWRGRGLLIIRRLAQHVDVRHEDTGTTVAMQWPLPGPPDGRTAGPPGWTR